jgi:hypothetical protein
LNDRTPRFLQVVDVYMVNSRPDLCMAVVDNASFERTKVPTIFCRGHKVELTFHFPSAPVDSVEYPALWEVRLDGEILGSLNGDIQTLDALGTRAIELADREIDRRLAAAKSKF